MSVDRRSMLGSVVGIGFAAQLSDRAVTSGLLSAPPLEPTETIDLWPGGAPGKGDLPLAEAIVERSIDPKIPDRALLAVNRPRMAMFRPAKSNGSSVLITPGGGYKWVVVDKEGYKLGSWLAKRGVTAFVLFYRLPGDGWAAGPNVVLQDTQRAIRVIRHRAKEFMISPGKVMMMGFSAGGHASADLSARFEKTVYQAIDDADSLSARPSLAASIYPVISMSRPHAHLGSREKLIGANATAALERAYSPHLNIPENAPPHFIVHAEDDNVVPVENALLLRTALRARGVAVETHLFAQGGHGFGLRKIEGKPAASWPQLFLAWAASYGL